MAALLFKSKPETRYPQDVLEGFSTEDKGKSFSQVFELVKARHPGIVHMFGTGDGHYLQFLFPLHGGRKRKG